MCSTLALSPTDVGTNSDVFLDTLPITSEKLSKRAERKAVTKAQNQRLLQLKSILHQQYERTNRCSEIIYLHEHSTSKQTKLSTNYCGKRWCTVCNANKTAELINGYSESVKSLSDLHFVTLTVPSVKSQHLKLTIKSMIHQFARIKDTLRKKGTPLSGIRKIECNYNTEADTYNPHFHLIIEGRATSVALVDLWLSSVANTVSDAQDITIADESTLMELFKYTSKSIVNSEFDAIAQDNINRAFVRVRAFQSFGKVKKRPTNVQNDKDDVEPDIDDVVTLDGNYRIVSSYYWNPFLHNWQNSDGVTLQPTTIRPKVKKLLSKVEYG